MVQLALALSEETKDHIQVVFRWEYKCYSDIQGTLLLRNVKHAIVSTLVKDSQTLTMA